MFETNLYTFDDVSGDDFAFVQGMAYVLDLLSGYAGIVELAMREHMGMDASEAKKVAYLVQKTLEQELDHDVYMTLAKLAENEVQERAQ